MNSSGAAPSPMAKAVACGAMMGLCYYYARVLRLPVEQVMALWKREQGK